MKEIPLTQGKVVIIQGVSRIWTSLCRCCNRCAAHCLVVNLPHDARCPDRCFHQGGAIYFEMVEGVCQSCYKEKS